MNANTRKSAWLTGGFFLLFGLLTAAVKLIDVRAIGPNDSEIGLAGWNALVRDGIGTHLLWYTITDWLGLVPVAIAFGFAVMGLVQLICRRSLCKVDTDILILGGFYVLTIAAYILFETVIVNYRPILMDGYLEASYPSSHTMMVICIMSTAMMEFHLHVKNRMVLRVLDSISAALIAVTIVGRIVSGVHWMTDIMGGVFLSAALVLLYRTALLYTAQKQTKPD